MRSRKSEWYNQSLCTLFSIFTYIILVISVLLVYSDIAFAEYHSEDINEIESQITENETSKSKPSMPVEIQDNKAVDSANNNLADIPLNVVFQKVPEPMNCDVGDPFANDWHTEGIRSNKSKINGTLFIICPTKSFKWGKFVIPINWFDRQGKGYTDCDWKTEGSHQCWITIPSNQLK